MSGSPEPESTSTSASPSSSFSCALDRTSPTDFPSRRKSPLSDVIGKGTSSHFVSYPISIPTVRRAHPSPDSRPNRSPVLSRVPVITTGRHGTASAGVPASSSPSPSDRLVRCDSPPELVVGMHRPVHLTDAKSCRESTYTGRRVCPEDGTPPGPDPRQLKFGMERILSEEMSPVIRRHQQQG
jgi:hypothetical protein